jgi:AcrR family transcriptional regulator
VCPSRTGTTDVPVDRVAEIREAALTLWARDGYLATSMRDIAEAVGLRVPTLYSHVESKETLLHGIMFSTVRDLDRRVAAAVARGQGPAGRLRLAVEAHVLYQALHPRENVIGTSEIRNLTPSVRSQLILLRDDYQNHFVSLIEDGIASSDFDVSSARLTAFAILGMNVRVSTWFRLDGELSAKQVATEFGVLALRMVGYRGAIPDDVSRPSW